MKAPILCGLLISFMVISCSTGDNTTASQSSKNMEEAEGTDITSGGGTGSGGLTDSEPAGDNPNENMRDNADLLDVAEFIKEKAAWEAQGIRHYRYATKFWSGSIHWEPSTEITVFPDREPEMVIYNGQGWEPLYGNTIDKFYQYIADFVNPSYMQWIRYSKEYHYPEYLILSYVPPPGEVGGGGEVKIEITEFEVLE